MLRFYGLYCISFNLTCWSEYCSLRRPMRPSSFCCDQVSYLTNSIAQNLRLEPGFASGNSVSSTSVPRVGTLSVILKADSQKFLDNKSLITTLAVFVVLQVTSLAAKTYNFKS